MKYKRILLKLSGEALMAEQAYGIDPKRLESYANEIKEIFDMDIEIAVVIGGGNIFRGVSGASEGMDRVQADYMGMLATVINGLALQSALENIGVPTRLQTALKIEAIAEPYIKRKATRHLEKGRVVIFGSGTGNPFFTTDTTACLRALELNANMVIKATRVNGVFDRDPEVDPNAVRYGHINYDFAIAHQLKIMDSTAFTLCRDHALPVRVIDLGIKGNLAQAVSGESVGTLVDVSGGSS